MLRPRPIRPYIYQPTLVFGVRTGDWKFIGGTVAIAFIVPFFLNLRIYGFHISPVLAIAALLAGTAFFNFVRVNHRPRWLENHISFYWREAIGRGQDITRISGARKDPEWIENLDSTKARRESWLFPTNNQPK
jgi:hypothetical protein